MDVSRYLDRIACGPVDAADAATLRLLQHAHLHTVPFENLDIRRGLPLALDIGALFDKIVVRRRGGICYEQNLLFAAVLRALGFQVDLLAAEVSTAGAGFGPPFDHMALLVTMGAQRFLADVGFGDSFLEPLDVDRRGEQPQTTAVYEVRHDGPWLVVVKRAHAAGSPAAASFRFQLRPHAPDDFLPMCLHHQTSAASHFTRKDICSKATPTGRVTISGDQLIATRDGSRVVTELRDSAQRLLALQTHFGMAV